LFIISKILSQIFENLISKYVNFVFNMNKSKSKAIELEKELELDTPIITREKIKLRTRKPSIYNMKIGEFMDELGKKNKYLPAQERMRRANKMYHEWKTAGAAMERT
jgi:hypothetical protein